MWRKTSYFDPPRGSDVLQPIRSWTRSIAVPVMIRIDRDACHVVPWQDAGLLLPLLGAVVTGLAQALEIRRIKEQILVALVRLDVVDGVGRFDNVHCSAHATGWLCLQLVPAQSIPALGLVQMVPRGCVRQSSLMRLDQLERPVILTLYLVYGVCLFIQQDAADGR